MIVDQITTRERESEEEKYSRGRIVFSAMEERRHAINVF